jgi:hypothetical protein
MTVDTVELRKIQYAQELAAYTMRQWTLMRDSPDPKHGESTSGPTSVAQTTAPSSGRETRDDISRYPSADLSWSVDSLLSAGQHAPTHTKP